MAHATSERTPGVGSKIAVDKGSIGGEPNAEVQWVKIMHGGVGAYTPVEAAAPFPVTVIGGVDTELPAALNPGDGLSNPSAPWTISADMGWDNQGAQWQRMRTAASVEASAGSTGVDAAAVALFDESSNTYFIQRGNNELTLIASAAFTATQATATQVQRSYRGVTVNLDVSSAGTGNLRLIVRGHFSNSQVNIVSIPADTLTTTGRITYTLYPGVDPAETDIAQPSNGFWRQISTPLPRRWSAQVVHSDGSSWTYSLGAMMHT